MSGKTIITIGREYGSGGREIGEQLAKELNIPFYDKELIALAAKKSGMSEEIFSDIDEKATNSLLYSLATGAYALGSRMSPMSDMPITDKLFILQSNLIKEMAQEGSCVIVGRCGDYVLRECPHVLNVFVHAPLEYRVQRVKEVYGVESGAQEAVRKTDKRRASYYSYYSSKKWGQASNYHLSLDSAKLGLSGCIQLLKTTIDLLEK